MSDVGSLTKYGDEPPIQSPNTQKGLGPIFKWAKKKQKEAELLNKANSLFPDFESVNRFNRLFMKASKVPNVQNNTPQPNQSSSVKNIDMLIRALNNNKSNGY